ncbi:MAG: fatty acid desaturase family protein [Myxococcota bacterium]
MKASDVLSRAEIAALTQRSNLRGAWEVARTWAIIVLTMTAAAAFPTWWMIALALVVLGNRQLALAILMHDAAHGILMRTPALNRFVGHWVCGVPNNVSMSEYRGHHIGHHGLAGTDRDPDRSLTAGYPTTPSRVARRFARDLLGYSSVKRLVGIVLMGTGKMRYTAAVDVQRLDTSGRSWAEAFSFAATHLGPYPAFNAGALLLLAAVGYAWLFALWWAAYLTTYSAFMRLRSGSEHACVPGGPDPRLHTRTVLPSRLGAMLWAPHYVHYHLEHHLLPTVPCYRLPELHAMLRARGALDGACVEHGGYLAVLRQLTSATRPAC